MQKAYSCHQLLEKLLGFRLSEWCLLLLHVVLNFPKTGVLLSFHEGRVQRGGRWDLINSGNVAGFGAI